MGEMIAKLFGRGAPRHRGIHRRRNASPHGILPMFDVRLLIPQADPWEVFV